MKFLIVLSVLVAVASAGQPARQKRGYISGYSTFDHEIPAYSPGFGSSYLAPVSYSSYPSYASYVPSAAYAPLAYSAYTPTLYENPGWEATPQILSVTVPKVVKVQKVVSVPQLIAEKSVVAPYTSVVGSPYNSGYASGWW